MGGMSEGDSEDKGPSGDYAGYSIAPVTVQYGPVSYVPAPPEKPPAKRARTDRLKSLVEGVGRFRSLFFDILFILLVAFLAFLAVYLAFSERKLIVEPIKAPAMLTQLGYSGDVAADRLVDAINDVEQAAKVRRNNLDVIPRSRNVEITVPEVGTLFDTSLYYVKQLFSRQDIQIAGEFICSTRECDTEGIYLRLRVLGGADATVNLETIGDSSTSGWEDKYFRSAAIDLLEKIDPYVAAAYYYDRKPDRAATIIRRILRGSHTKEDIALANNLLGVMDLHSGRYTSAIDYFSNAIEIEPELTEAYSNWGNALLSQHRTDEAIAKYEMAIRLDPEFASAHANIADALMRLGNVDEAIEKYRTAINIDPNIAYAYANLGDAFARKGDALTAVGDTQNAEVAYAMAFDYFRDAIDIEPALVFAYVSWGNALMKQGAYDGALRKIEEGLDNATTRDIPNRNGTLAYVNASLGDLHIRIDDDPKTAIRHYREALKFRQDNLQALAGLGDALSSRRRYDEAIEHYQKALEAKEDYVRAAVGLGDAWYHKGKSFHEQAETAYRQAVEYQEDAFRAHEGLGNIAFSRGDYVEAETHFAEAVRHNVNAVHSHAGIGNVEFRLGKYAEASDAFAKALEVNPDVAYIQAGYASANARLGACDTSIPSFDKATLLSPTSAYIYRDWQATLRKCGREIEIPAALRRWAEASPGSAEPQFLLAQAYLELGVTHAAAQHCRLAVRINPEHTDATMLLAELDGSYRLSGPR
ncbi:tetratricopeptide repeat protein [Hoeflea sp. CAU 1731]